MDVEELLRQARELHGRRPDLQARAPSSDAPILTGWNTPQGRDLRQLHAIVGSLIDAVEQLVDR